MTDQQHDELVKRMGAVNERIECRDAMLGRLSGFRQRFPDEDLQVWFDAIKAEAQRRNETDARLYAELEFCYNMLGGKEWEAANIA